MAQWDEENGGVVEGETQRLLQFQHRTHNASVDSMEAFDIVPELNNPLNGIHNINNNYESIIGSEHSGYSDDESVRTISALPGMTIKCHSINSNHAPRGRRGGSTCIIRPSTTQVALKEVQKERRLRREYEHSSHQVQVESNDQTCNVVPSLVSGVLKESYWIDIETHLRSTDELYDFLKQLRLPPFFLSILSEPATWTTQVIALKNASLAIFQILPTHPTTKEVVHVALLTMPRLLVTFSTFPEDVEAGYLYPMVSQYLKERERVPEPTSSGLLLAWMQFHIRRTSKAIRALRLVTIEMDENMDAESSTFEFEHLVEAKNCLLRVLQVSEEQDEIVDGLIAAELSTEGLNFQHCKGAFSMLQANSKSNERLSQRVEKHMNELRERIMAQREVDLNQRVSMLTMITAIFLPLTLLTGIWGMNFEHMPELTGDRAYYKALFGMFTLALTLVCCFRRAGWMVHY